VNLALTMIRGGYWAQREGKVARDARLHRSLMTLRIDDQHRSIEKAAAKVDSQERKAEILSIQVAKGTRRQSYCQIPSASCL
jgi:hypothetical protein